jgi:hypothetical protein
MLLNIDVLAGILFLRKSLMTLATDIPPEINTFQTRFWIIGFLNPPEVGERKNAWEGEISS